ncbi:preprotein translocase subunit SecB [Acetobacter musti]|uniref:Preprotein translocase subunit SecB n=1 Tax=Acetobacter musti TaxID=864732 RepID=A0ABX0JN31_9PROT|nr:protein-export chaperone SecB [Acetobacter musti]NHN84163.1 preprotein translocase subunit SecB [Acetobacter musti]
MVDLKTMETVTGAGTYPAGSGTDSVTGTGTAPGQRSSRPAVLMGAQYVRSVTFRVVDSIMLHTRPPVRPNTSLTLDVNARQVGENLPDFEVDLGMRCHGMADAPADGSQPPTLFEADIIYSGLFSLRNVTAETFEPLLLIEAPRMLFPAARNYLADLTREAGFLPVILQQFDFEALWMSQQAQKKAG